MTLPATRFLTGGRTRLIGTSLGSPTGVELPNSAMFWPTGVTAGWPAGDLAGYNRVKDMWGRKPDTVRLYWNSPFATTGVTGSAGNYGAFTTDQRAIANDGCFLVITFKDNVRSGSGGWATIAANLNAAGSNSTKTDYLNLIQNLKRWRDDTGNTAAIKSLIFGFHHEPSNDGGTGANFVAACQAIVNFCLDNGIGYGPKPATGHGSAWAGTWYDMLEWCHVGIGADMGANNGSSYAYYPGDGFAQWVFGDIFNWSGGYPDSGGTGFTVTRGGGIAQPGDTGPFGHYTDSLKPLRQVAQNPLNWYKAGPGGKRNIRLGLGEWAISEDLDRFPVVGSALSGAKTHSADKHIKGDWFTGALKWFRGEAFTVPGGHDAGNNIPADTDGLLIVAPIYWNSQAAQPRWWNTRPFNTGDTTAPTTTGGTSTGTDASYGYDQFFALVNDSIFTTTPVVHTPPTASFVAALTEGGGAGDWTFDATAVAGDSAIVSYAWDPGDGTGIVTHTTAALTDELVHSYAGTGLFTVTLLVTDTNGLTSGVLSHQVVVNPANALYSLAPLLAPGDPIRADRPKINSAFTALEDYTARGGGTTVIAASGAAQTLQDPRIARFVDITLTAGCTITLPPAPTAGEILRVVVRQDATGSRTLAWTHANAIKWPAATAPTQTATAASSDEYEFECVTAGTWRGRRYAADVR